MSALWAQWKAAVHSALASDDAVRGVAQVLAEHAGARACVEQCVRERLAAAEKKSGGGDAASVGVELETGLRLLESGAIKGEQFVALAQDVLEAADIGTCERRFGLIERHAAALAALLSKTALLVLLRMCVELMRRMSKSEHTAFSGRVLLFLAQVYPLSDPSGVNLKGELNTANVTLFEDEHTFHDEQQLHHEQHAAKPQDQERPPPPQQQQQHDRPIDYQFYKTFWSLQSQLRDTGLVLATPDAWHVFENALDTVLAALSTQRVTVAGGASEARDDADAFVKYLTSSSLLDLQLSDANFRRHVLLQMLIAFQTLLDKTPDPLSSTQRTRVVALKKRALALLRATPPNGEAFEAAVARLLKREGGWTAWKAGGCASFEREREPLKRKRDAAPPPTGKRAAATASSGAAAAAAHSNDQAMRAAQLPPTFDELLQPLRNDLVEFEDDVDFGTDHVFAWRLLRGAAANKLGLLSRLVGVTKASEVFRIVDEVKPAKDDAKDKEKFDEPEPAAAAAAAAVSSAPPTAADAPPPVENVESAETAAAAAVVKEEGEEGEEQAEAKLEPDAEREAEPPAEVNGDDEVKAESTAAAPEEGEGDVTMAAPDE